MRRSFKFLLRPTGRQLQACRFLQGAEESPPSSKENEMSTRTTCLHCGETILRRQSDGNWFSNPVGDPYLGIRCVPGKQHSPAPVDADDRLTAAYSRALDGAKKAGVVLAKGHEQAARDRVTLAKAAESLNAYLTELER